MRRDDSEVVRVITKIILVEKGEKLIQLMQFNALLR